MTYLSIQERFIYFETGSQGEHRGFSSLGLGLGRVNHPDSSSDVLGSPAPLAARAVYTHTPTPSEQGTRHRVSL